MAVTYKDVDLGYVQSVSSTDMALVSAFPLPGQDESNNPIMNIGGKTVRISVSTTYKGTSGEIASKITELKALITGSDNGGALVLESEASKNAMLEKFSYTQVVMDGPVGIIKFTFDFVVGSPISIW